MAISLVEFSWQSEDQALGNVVASWEWRKVFVSVQPHPFPPLGVAVQGPPQKYSLRFSVLFLDFLKVDGQGRELRNGMCDMVVGGRGM